jgi:hypothetical protein
MSRPLRIQCPGAVYHVMNRGRVRRVTFVDDADSGVPRAWVSAARNRRASGSALCDGESTAQKAGATGVGCRIAILLKKSFSENQKKNILHTDALYRTIGTWLIIFFIPNFHE